MTANFDELIERAGTNSLKYDTHVRRGMPADLLPLWVADMDFKTPPAVTAALKKAAEFGIFGYSEPGEGYFKALSGWYARYYDWQLKEDWLVKTPGVVFALFAAVRALTEPGGAVLIQPPVYYPFSEAVLKSGRRLIENPLIFKDGRYSIDFENFEQKIVENNVKLFILCSPHNPVGRVYTVEELNRLGEIAKKHEVFVVSDEIHADFVYSNHKHHVFANLNPAFSQFTVTCTAPSKSFNLAGLQVANILIENPDLRWRFQKEVEKSGYSQLNGLGLIACEAAYREGRDWFEQLLCYLKGNLDFTRRFLNEKLPEIKLIEPEGTYLLWLDCRALGLEGKALEELIIKKAKLWLDSGSIFGTGGEGFERINIACPRETLARALTQLEHAVHADTAVAVSNVDFVTAGSVI